jgi:hypothetical protein
MGHQHFWERIDVFFSLRVLPPVYNSIKDFYQIPEEQAKTV